MRRLVIERARRPPPRARRRRGPRAPACPGPAPARSRRASSSRAGLRLAAEPSQAGERQHDRVVVAARRACAGACRRCPRSGVDLEVGPDREQLRAPAQARRPDASRPVGKAVERRRADQRVARVLGPRHRGDRESRRQLARDVLGAVHREVDLAARAARPRSPSRSGTCRRSRRRDRPDGRDRHQLGRPCRARSASATALRLGERQRAAARADPQRLQRLRWPRRACAGSA